MPVVLKTERKHIGTRLFWGFLYTMLAIGAASMIYPFLLMVSGSFKSRVDANDMDLVPRFFSDDAVLFTKYVESKYGEDLQLYQETTGDEVRNFGAVEAPTVDNELVDLWHSFVTTRDLPASWYLTGFGPTLEGKIIQKNERLFRESIKAQCAGRIDTFRETFKEPIENWFFLKFRAERLVDPNYQVSRTRLMDAFYAFKESLPHADRIYVSCDRAFHAAFGQNPVLTVRSDKTPAWESFVRKNLHPQFVQVEAESKRTWETFLQARYATVAGMNKLYVREYTSFADVPFPPEDRIRASAELTDYMVFYADEQRVPVDQFSVDTPETRWRAFLKEHGRAIAAMPQKQADYAFCLANRGAIKRQFAARNFKMVFEYVLLYGQGIRNTVIYCLLSILLALLINPMAAYALSRYKLPGTYKILLFLIATMAFPTVVTMIPNFLLLRDLGLLNTFAALLLPTMANGYSVFLLKGFFDSLPPELFEAAEIDGAGEWTKFWMLTMNLSKPILAVIALGAFTAAYSNFMYAFILCQDRDMWTLMVWLYQLQQFSSQGVVFASLLVAAIPTLLVFVLCQNIILRGIVVPTEK